MLPGAPHRFLATRLVRLAPVAALVVLAACQPDRTTTTPSDGLAPMSGDAAGRPVGVRRETVVTAPAPPVSPAESFEAARADADAVFMELAGRGDCEGLAEQERFWLDRTALASDDVAAIAAELAQRAGDVRRFIGCVRPD